MDSILRYRMGLSFETIGPVGESEESCLAKFLPASDQIHGKRVFLRFQEVSGQYLSRTGPNYGGTTLMYTIPSLS